MKGLKRIIEESITREDFLKHHDPQRWMVEK